MLTAKQVADYFLARVDTEAGDSLSNLKLQKLVYYAQGISLALTGNALYPEEIQAWQHGPVVPALYRTLKQHGSEPVPAPEGGINLAQYPTETQEILDDVYSVFGQYSASKLRNLTHEEPPWKEAMSIGVATPISLETMREYFSTFVNG